MYVFTYICTRMYLCRYACMCVCMFPIPLWLWYDCLHRALKKFSWIV